MKTHLLALAILSLTLAACSPKNTNEKPQGVLTDAQKQTLDEAKKTADMLDKANKERMKAVDEVEK